MLDFVSFACPGREVAGRDPQPQFRSKFLQFNLPQSNAISVASPAIGANQQVSRPGIDLFAHAKPPASNTGRGEGGRIVIGPDVDPTHVLADIINTIWNNFGRFWGSKVMNLHLFRLSFRLPFLPAILEISNKLFLLRINRNDRLMTPQKRNFSIIQGNLQYKMLLHCP